MTPSENPAVPQTWNDSDTHRMFWGTPWVLYNSGDVRRIDEENHVVHWGRVRQLGWASYKNLRNFQGPTDLNLNP